MAFARRHAAQGVAELIERDGRGRTGGGLDLVRVRRRLVEIDPLREVGEGRIGDVREWIVLGINYPVQSDDRSVDELLMGASDRCQLRRRYALELRQIQLQGDHRGVTVILTRDWRLALPTIGSDLCARRCLRAGKRARPGIVRPARSRSRCWSE